MAGIPLNTFRTYTKVLKYFDPYQAHPTGPFTLGNDWFVYQAPPGTTGIILYMQVANSGIDNFTASAWYYRPTSGIFTDIVKNVICPVNDARIMLGGKLVLETGDMLFVSGNDDSNSVLKLIVSVLESANQ
jgi:hypothetical protein